jgi:hypothetical protein
MEVIYRFIMTVCTGGADSHLFINSMFKKMFFLAKKLAEKD